MRSTNITGTSLREVWQNYKTENPKVRIRDAAKELGVSEVELLVSECDGENIVRLRPEWKNIFKNFPELGFVMALTRNESAISEIKGYYKNVNLDEKGGVVLDDKIDLRVFFDTWTSGFFVNEFMRDSYERKSFHFFDKFGNAVHKVYQTNESKAEQFYIIADKYRNDDQAQNIIVQPFEYKRELQKDADVDVADLRSRWISLTDTHEFFGFLKEMNVTRIQAFRLAGEDLAMKINPDKFPYFLQSVAEKKIKLMTFIGNDGMLQIFSDYIQNVKLINEWVNILDDNFNMHLRMDLVDSAWIVKKKKGNRWIVSLELFDNYGNIISLFFNKKKETEPETKEWLSLIESLK